ncbi:OprO/OprP family phosphate-selective porin [Pendulispora albinea]|uniref:Porin n=1 Tax=Pendulispora albinea TaxID=2741071 RepID=A0ABZ2LWX5_9BACT
MILRASAAEAQQPIPEPVVPAPAPPSAGTPPPSTGAPAPATPPAPPPPAPPPSSASPAPSSSVGGAPVEKSAIANLEERLDEADQRSRIAMRKLELMEEAAAAKEKARAVVKMGPGGLAVTSADGANTLALRGVLQVDGRIFVNDEHKLTDTFIVRRARPILDATLGKNFTARFMPDFGGGQTLLTDAYVDARAANEFAVTVGKFKPSVGLERLQAEQATYFVERGLPTSFVPARDVGVAVHGDLFGNRLGYSVGLFNGVVDGAATGDVDFDDSKEVTVHLYARPFASTLKDVPPPLLSGFFIGIAGTRGEKTGTAANPYLPQYRTTGQNVFYSYIADASATAPAGSTAVAAGVHNRLTGHIYVPIGPFALLGEYVASQQRVARLASSRLLTHQAWSVTGVLALTGEDARFEGIAPKHPFDLSEGHVGAIELVARYGGVEMDRDSYNDFSLDTRSARAASELGAGLNWYLTRNYRVTGDYFYTEFRSGGASAAGGRRDLEQVFLLRNQVAF